MTKALNPKYQPPSGDMLSNTLIPAWCAVEKKIIIIFIPFLYFLSQLEKSIVMVSISNGKYCIGIAIEHFQTIPSPISNDTFAGGCV